MTRDETAFAAAVASAADHLLVIAPPGCGKTELLARRSVHLVSGLEPYQRILALTYSNKARANLETRLREALGWDRLRRLVAVRNFHGHAAELIKAHGTTLGIDPASSLPDRQTLKRAMAPVIDGLSPKDSAELQSRIEADLRAAKQGPRTDAQVLEWLQRNACPEALVVEVDRQVSGALHYDDLLRHAQRLIRVPQIAALYQVHYGAVLVDEFQDLSPQQLDLALRSCGTRRTFVGDPLQGIYSWTGARPVQVERRLRRLCGEPNGLGVSYRSSPRVLDVVNAVAESLGGHPLQADPEGSWHEGGVASFGTFGTGADEAKFVVEMSQEILKKHPNQTIGVIARMGWRRELVDEAFEQTQLRVIRWDRVIEDPALLRILVAARDRLGSKSGDVESFRREVLAGVDVADEDTRADLEAAVDLLVEQAGGAAGFRSVLDQLMDPDTDTAIPAGVHLLNAHVGKGQQFDWVFIPGFEDGHIPSFLAKGSAQELEEKRILLVMLSRARHGVIVTSARGLISRAGRPYTTTRSPYADLIEAAAGSDLAAVIAQVERYAPDGDQSGRGVAVSTAHDEFAS